MSAIELTNHVIEVKHIPWQEVGEETHCGKDVCHECRIVDHITQGKGTGQYHPNRPSDNPWLARVVQVIEVKSRKQYRVWIVELFKKDRADFEVKTVVEQKLVNHDEWRYR